MQNESYTKLTSLVEKMEQQLLDIEQYTKSVSVTLYESRTMLESLELDLANALYRSKYHDELLTQSEFKDLIESYLKQVQNIGAILRGESND